jgi:type II secretory pathway component PulM
VVIGVILAAVTAYKTIWQPAGVAPHIERSTSPKRKAP